MRSLVAAVQGMEIHVGHTTTNLTFMGGFLLPPKVTFGGSFGFGGGLYKTAPNSNDTNFFYL